MAFEASQEQALAVYISAGEAVRFLIGQRWQVTNYALLAYVALAAAPEWISRNGRRSQIAAGLLCTIFAFVIFGLTSFHLWNLHEQHADQLDLVYAAGKKLPLVEKLRGWPPPPIGPGRVLCALVAALFIGALLVAWINLSRPGLAAWFTTRRMVMVALFAAALLVAWIIFCFVQHSIQAERAHQGETWGPGSPFVEDWLT
jgi:hypothetical protein